MRQRGAGFVARTLKTTSFGFNFGLGSGHVSFSSNRPRSKSLSLARPSPKRPSPSKDVQEKLMGVEERDVPIVEKPGEILSNLDMEEQENEVVVPTESQLVLGTRKRGRPKKIVDASDFAAPKPKKESVPTATKTRGRPRKEAATTSTKQPRRHPLVDITNVASVKVHNDQSSAERPLEDLNDTHTRNEPVGIETTKARKRGRPPKPKSGLGEMNIALKSNLDTGASISSKRMSHKPEAQGIKPQLLKDEVTTLDSTSNASMSVFQQDPTGSSRLAQAFASVAPIYDEDIQEHALSVAKVTANTARIRQPVPRNVKLLPTNETLSSGDDEIPRMRKRRRAHDDDGEFDVVPKGPKAKKPRAAAVKKDKAVFIPKASGVHSMEKDEPYQSLFNNPAIFGTLTLDRDLKPLSQCPDRPIKPTTTTAPLVSRLGVDEQLEATPAAPNPVAPMIEEPTAINVAPDIAIVPRRSARAAAEASKRKLKEIALREAAERAKDEEDTRQRHLAKKLLKKSTSRGQPKAEISAAPRKRDRPPSRKEEY